ncbi:ExbD/TolR family protein [Acinetobacter boissieri]|uniref:Biopolymer transport protein ExbD n=1 Tax=Acinetobacter boissieri TaxID=1219383 RepID=A0A1G6H0E8_9GAMM|nr:biopolymer transporter ExbD [Acinetobacter boissieri]SDB87742.1 biopolymer transport protein ExbD [Acinetobacter boissieri]
MGMTPSPSSSDDDGDVMLEVNMTPLIDVMLVLIIMFIITIPIPNNAININMPAPSPPTNEKPPEVVTINIKPNGDILWNGERVADKTILEARLTAVSKQAEQDQVHIKPEAQASYKDVALVMAAAQRLGVKNMGIMNGE